MVSPSPQIFAFVGFTPDLNNGRLRRGNDDVRLRAKSFALLEFFTRNSGRIIPKDELLSAVWPDVTVTEDSLTRCVHELRRALGQEGAALLQTVPRRGYLFDVPKHVPDRPAASANAVVIEQTLAGTADEGKRLRRDGVAVLPFVLVGPATAADQGLLDGLGHDIIGRLARLRSFHVIARGSSFALGPRISAARPLTWRFARPVVPCSLMTKAPLHAGPTGGRSG